MKKIFLILLGIFFCFSTVYANEIGMLVEEEDGDPAGFAVKLKLTNGSLTDNADGSFSLDFTGSGISDIVEDTTPQLGGDLDTNGSDITLANGDKIRVSTTTSGHKFCIQAYDVDGTTWTDVLCFENANVPKMELQSGTEFTGLADWNIGGGSLEIPNANGDVTLAVGGRIAYDEAEDQLAIYDSQTGELAAVEAAIPLIQHLAMVVDPAWYYDQETTYRVLPLIYVGDDLPNGLTITEWKVNYVAGDPTTELDADIMCDTTPDFNPAAGATVMDVIDTTAGASSADTGFDSASCANGSRLYIRFGADPTDANVVIAFDLWYYVEED